MYTHEQFIHDVAAAVAAHASPEDQAALGQFKLVYGAGQAGLRGVTYYHRWKPDDGTTRPFVEVCAFGQESRWQLAGTTIHEMAHIVAGFEAGHTQAWKDAALRLGLRNARAAGHTYTLAGFTPALREFIASLPEPADGQPVALVHPRTGRALTVKPCGAGIGTRGGKSRGPGSGSRLRLWECGCEPPIKVRCSRELHAHCDDCGCAFKRA